MHQPPDIDNAWYCLRAEGRREHLAASNLRRFVRVDSFAPRIRLKKICRDGGIMARTEALFPGYLFCRFAYPSQVRHVLSAQGVTGIVAFGAHPPSIEEETIAHLRLHTDASPAETLSPIFSEGDWVRVANGIFRGAEGRVERMDQAHQRVSVLLYLLGQEVKTSLPAAALLHNSELASVIPAALRKDERPLLQAVV